MIVWTVYAPAAAAIALAAIEAALPKIAHRRHVQFEQRDVCIPAAVYELVLQQARIAGFHMDPRPNGLGHEAEVRFFPYHARIVGLECRLCQKRRTIVHGLRWWPVR